MRAETKRAYEKRIESLQRDLAAALAVVQEAHDETKRHRDRAFHWKRNYDRLVAERQQGEHARNWAVELAIKAGQGDNVVSAAAQICDFIYGPDMEATRPEETE